MSDAAVSPAVNEDEAALAMPFVRCLVRLIRAQDASGSREGKSDAELLGDFITRKQRRASPSLAIRSGRAVEARYVLHGRRA
ncbi:hypothetical protein NKJ13_28510 [Mesorhizobium sp. M0174]|uniref:hypothetical protein n=1 Tax=Mesorhizobium sp. M0174 TaxID=2956904 RepID=UPI0033390725